MPNSLKLEMVMDIDDAIKLMDAQVWNNARPIDFFIRDSLIELKAVRAELQKAREQEPVLRINVMGGGMQWNPNYKGDWHGEFYAAPVPAMPMQAFTLSDEEITGIFNRFHISQSDNRTDFARAIERAVLAKAMPIPKQEPAGAVPDVNFIASTLMDAWKHAEPHHGVTAHITSYVATFVDMARAVIRTHFEPSPRITEQDARQWIEAAISLLDDYAPNPKPFTGIGRALINKLNAKPLVHVDYKNAKADRDGSLERPFQTIAEAMPIAKKEPIYMWRLEDDGWMECTKEWFYAAISEGCEKRIFYAEPQPAQAAAIPDWLMEMSQQMRTQDNRGTSHPFFQVRCKEYLPTDPDCSADRWEIVGDDGVVCAQGDEDGLVDYLLANHADWYKQWNEENHDEESDRDALESWFDPTGGELPDPLRLIWTQEVEKIVSTHLTEAGALQFIARKQHDYPKLYTYAESAYWSPQLRQLQDWIISLSAPKPDEAGA